MGKINNQFALNILLALLLVFSFSTNSFGQTEESDEQSDVVIPEQSMKQIVRRILIWSFKARKKPKVIYLAKRIGRAENEIQTLWLPEIKNIEF